MLTSEGPYTPQTTTSGLMTNQTEPGGGGSLIHSGLIARSRASFVARTTMRPSGRRKPGLSKRNASIEAIASFEKVSVFGRSLNSQLMISSRVECAEFWDTTASTED